MIKKSFLYCFRKVIKKREINSAKMFSGIVYFSLILSLYLYFIYFNSLTVGCPLRLVREASPLQRKSVLIINNVLM